MFTEGPSWLPNRIYGNHIAAGCVNRVIVIHSPKQLDCQRVGIDNKDLENTTPLLNEITRENEQLQSDSEFLYGLQLLQSCTREFSDNCDNRDHSVSLYRRVFNVR
jgi:hypothetical protein